VISYFSEAGNEWKSYRPGRTGYSGAEAISIAQDASGQLWFGTLTAGIDRFLPRKDD
jgi:hypothetical protein